MSFPWKLMATAWLCTGLSACDPPPSGDAGGQVECAIGAGAQWRHDCPIERSGDLLLVRHADGGFRRFRIVQDGRGLASADGAENSIVNIVGHDRIELVVGEDRYRMPATIAQSSTSQSAQ